MKKALYLILFSLVLLVGSSSMTQAQCPVSNPGNNSCFALPNGSCCLNYSGKFRLWITGQLVQQAKPMLDQEFNYSFWQYLQKYYSSGELDIQYVGGSWETKQSFQIQMGGCIGIISIEDF